MSLILQIATRTTLPNLVLTFDNEQLIQGIKGLKEKLQDHYNSVQEFNESEQKINDLQNQIHEIEQYLRINNIEIVGLQASNVENGETEETIIVNFIKSLVGLPKPICPEDIDISHPLKSQRRENKPVHVVRFISRKTIYDVLTGSIWKQTGNSNFEITMYT